MAPRPPAGTRTADDRLRTDRAHGPLTWAQRKNKPAWINARNWEFVSTGKLELIVDGPGTAYQGDHYRDAKTTTVENKLPDVFRSFEIYRLRAEAKEREQNREKAEHQQLWEAAMGQARHRYEQHARWEHFKKRSTEWQAVHRHREFLEAARSALDGVAGEQRTEILAQLHLAEQTLGELDPIQHLELLVPDVPEPGPDELKAFLDGWSAHGPNGRLW